MNNCKHILSLIYSPLSVLGCSVRVILSFILILIISGFCPARSQDIKILVVTGGHEFEQETFAEMFDALPGISWEMGVQPNVNRMMVDGKMEPFDVLVFYDMFQTITEEEKAAFIGLLKEGKPILFLHHAVVSYQNWSDFKQIIGGKYYEKALYEGVPNQGYSSYLHDTDVRVEIVDKKHPAVKGLVDFTLFDEVYGNTESLSSVHPLLKTSHKNSSKLIGWEHQYEASTIIYLQPGHGKETYADANYRRLLLQSIQYLSKTN